MMPKHHIMISLGLGAVIGIVLKSWGAAVACLFSGVLIDLDHVIDYILARGRMTLSWDQFLEYCTYDMNGKLYLFFHSFEAVILMWMCAYFFQFNAVAYGFIIGLTVHMLCDQTVNPLKPLGYFIIYRIYHHFRRDKIFTKNHYDKILSYNNV